MRTAVNMADGGGNHNLLGGPRDFVAFLMTFFL